MNQKTIILTVILFALIVVGMFVYAKIRNTELTDQKTQSNNSYPTLYRFI